MAPDERMWRPVVAMPEQCNYCMMYFHEDIGGICSPCYQLMMGENEERSGRLHREAMELPDSDECSAGVQALQEDLQSGFPAGTAAEEE